MKRHATRKLPVVLGMAGLAVFALTFASRTSATTVASGATRFAVARVPTAVTNSELSYPGSGGADNAFSPAQSDLTSCDWRDGIPNMPMVPRSSPSYPDIKCQPLIPGRSFGLLESPEGVDYGVLRVAREDLKTHAISVGPILLTYGEGAGSWPAAASADGWIWVYVPSQQGADLLRFSSSNGELAQRISIPSMHEPVMAANDSGVFLGWSNQGGIGGDVYFVSIGSSRAQLLQRTTRFSFMMEGTAHAMTVIEAYEAAGPFVAYRFTSLEN
jgi:hypothetical protein